MGWSFPYIVEVVAFFTCACQYSFDTVQYQFIYQVVSEELNFTKDHSVHYCSQNSTSDEAEQAVADGASRWTLYSMLAGYITGVIGGVTFTSWSDSIGRKKAIAFPVVGTLIAAVAQCLIVTFRLPLYTLIITELVYGASGSYSALMNIGCAYLSDTVKLEDRGRRYNVLEVFASVGGGAVQIGTGYWIDSSGFVPTSIFIACCAFVAMLCIPFMKSTNRIVDEFSETSSLLSEPYDVKFSDNITSQDDNTSQLSIKSLIKQLKTSWEIYTMKGCVCEECLEDTNRESKHSYVKNGRRWRLWFYALAFAIYMFAVNGVALFMTMFLVSYPVCFTPDLVGAQAGLNNGLVIAVPLLILLLQGYLKFEGQSIILLGVIARVCSSSMMSVAQGPVLVFAATSLAVVYNMTTAFIRSGATRLVSSKEQGATLAVISGMENLACIFSPLVFLTVYPATLHIFHGFSLVVAAMVYAVSLTLMTVVWIADKRKAKYQLLT